MSIPRRPLILCRTQQCKLKGAITLSTIQPRFEFGIQELRLMGVVIYLYHPCDIRYWPPVGCQGTNTWLEQDMVIINSELVAD